MVDVQGHAAMHSISFHGISESRSRTGQSEIATCVVSQSCLEKKWFYSVFPYKICSTQRCNRYQFSRLLLKLKYINYYLIKILHYHQKHFYLLRSGSGQAFNGGTISFSSSSSGKEDSINDVHNTIISRDIRKANHGPGS